MKNQVKWLIETVYDYDGVEEEITPGFIQSLQDLNYDFKTITCNSFEKNQNFYDYFGPDECVVFYGGIFLAKKIQRECSWTPGVIGTFNRYDMIHLMAHYKSCMVNYDGVFVPFNIILSEWERTHNILRERWFIRPNSSEKLFSGCVLESEYDLKYVEMQCTPETLIFKSNKKFIGSEYRLIISDKKIIAWSKYRMNGDIEPCIDASVASSIIELSQKILDSFDWTPDEIFVLDVTMNMKSGIEILEMNTLSTSAFYACDQKAIIENVSNYASKEWNSHYT